MSDLHQLRVSSDHQIALEKVSSEFTDEKLLWARDQSWKVLQEIQNELKEGLTEDDARKIALEIFRGHGVTKHWHKPYIRFGPGTTQTFHEPLQENYRLKIGDPYYLDLGPVWPDEDSGLSYEGDVGDTFIFESSNATAEKCAQTARDLFNAIQSDWISERLTGEQIYQKLDKLTVEAGYILNKSVDGHRICDFPHHKYSKERLANTNFVPSPTLWVLEIHIKDADHPIGAFYEDMLQSKQSGAR